MIRKEKRSRIGRIQNGEEGRGEGQQKPVMYENYTMMSMMLYTNKKHKFLQIKHISAAFK